MSATEQSNIKDGAGASSIKDEAGPHFWYVMEKVLNKLPDNPKKSDIRRAQRTMDHIAESFPCDECVESYHTYKKEHPLDCHTKAECSNYLCEFHNNIRRKQGKSTIDCATKEEKPAEDDCPGCKAEAKGVPDVDIDRESSKELGLGESTDSDLPSVDKAADIKLGAVKPQSITPTHHIHKAVGVVKALDDKRVKVHSKNSLDELKNVTRRIVEDLCREHGAPVPEIYFSPCPSNTKTSCTRVPVDQQGKLVKELPTKLYFDPHSYAPRSIVHEVTHYIAKWKGDDKLFKDEVAVDAIARQVIDAGFTEYEPNSLNGAVPMPTEMAQVAHDMFSDGPNWLANAFKERADKRLAEWKRNFPTFSRLFSGPAADQPVQINTNPEPPVRAEPPPETKPHTAYTDGFMTLIDPVFSPIANITGLQPRDIGDAHIPNLLGSIITTIADSNLNDFGSLLVSAGGAGVSLLIGVLAKDQLGFGDRRFLMGMGGNLLWNSLQYIANPQRSKTVFTNANMFGKAISSLDAQGMHYCVAYQGESVPKGTVGAIPKLSPEQVRNMQKEQGFQPDVPIQNTYPIQGSSTGGIGAPYGGKVIPAGYPQAATGGARPYGNLDADFDEYSLEENNRIARAQRAAFSPAIA